ncbi:MAG: hypothetical protein HOK62_04120, partial [Verrucomicrobiales bacterium]|nr:hypothetical protein [Verrucomicrobiales bacterium]
ELPDAEELRQVPITKPAAPVTTDDDDDAPEQMSLEEVTAAKDSDAGELATEAAEAEEEYDEDEFEDDGDDDEDVEEASKQQ